VGIDRYWGAFERFTNLVLRWAIIVVLVVLTFYLLRLAFPGAGAPP
jgi:hypothetical protein